MPIVFVSSYARDVLDNTPASPGPYRYVTKPFNLPELEDAIESLLAEIGSPLKLH